MDIDPPWLWAAAVAGALAALGALLLLLRLLLRLHVGTCRCAGSLRGQLVVVTGANAGLGYETALALARRGARVVLACRDEERARAARDRIVAATGNPEVLVRRLDLASLASVRQFAAELAAAEPRLHVLVNNAGVYARGNTLTADGLVLEMQVNHFAPFLLTLLLLPRLRAARGRVVTVSSVLHWLGTADTARMNTPGAYGDLRTYCNSKLCGVALSAELARREAGRVAAVSLHPGIVRTGVAEGALFAAWCWLCARSAAEGAQSALHAAASAQCAAGGPGSGQYLQECRPRRWSRRPRAHDPALARKLWEYSERLVHYRYEDVPTDDKL